MTWPFPPSDKLAPGYCWPDTLTLSAPCLFFPSYLLSSTPVSSSFPFSATQKSSPSSSGNHPDDAQVEGFFPASDLPHVQPHPSFFRAALHFWPQAPPPAKPLWGLYLRNIISMHFLKKAFSENKFCHFLYIVRFLKLQISFLPGLTLKSSPDDSATADSLTVSGNQGLLLCGSVTGKGVPTQTPRESAWILHNREFWASPQSKAKAGLFEK